MRDYEYVYLHVEMLGLEARTKSVSPTFPLFFHERLRFERVGCSPYSDALLLNLHYLVTVNLIVRFPIFNFTRVIQGEYSKGSYK